MICAAFENSRISRVVEMPKGVSPRQVLTEVTKPALFNGRNQCRKMAEFNEWGEEGLSLKKGGKIKTSKYGDLKELWISAL